MSDFELTARLVHNLSLKAAAYVDRSEDEKNKVLIFTDDADLWVPNENTSIHTDHSMPPIPDDYRSEHYNALFDKMLKCIHQYLRSSIPTADVYWALYNSGNTTTPKMHVLFSHYDLQDYQFSFVKPTITDPLALPGDSPEGTPVKRPKQSLWGHLSTIVSIEKDGGTAKNPPSCSTVKPPRILVTNTSINCTDSAENEPDADEN